MDWLAAAAAAAAATALVGALGSRFGRLCLGPKGVADSGYSPGKLLSKTTSIARPAYDYYAYLRHAEQRRQPRSGARPRPLASPAGGTLTSRPACGRMPNALFGGMSCGLDDGRRVYMMAIGTLLLAAMISYIAFFAAGHTLGYTCAMSPRECSTSAITADGGIPSLSATGVYWPAYVAQATGICVFSALVLRGALLLHSKLTDAPLWQCACFPSLWNAPKGLAFALWFAVAGSACLSLASVFSLRINREIHYATAVLGFVSVFAHACLVTRFQRNHEKARHQRSGLLKLKLIVGFLVFSFGALALSVAVSLTEPDLAIAYRFIFPVWELFSVGVYLCGLGVAAVYDFGRDVTPSYEPQGLTRVSSHSNIRGSI